MLFIYTYQSMKTRAFNIAVCGTITYVDVRILPLDHIHQRHGFDDFIFVFRMDTPTGCVIEKLIQRTSVELVVSIKLVCRYHMISILPVHVLVLQNSPAGIDQFQKRCRSFLS